MHEQSLEILKIVREAIDKIIVLLETEPTPVAENLTIIENMVTEIIVSEGKIRAVECADKTVYKTETVIVAADSSVVIGRDCRT